MAWYWWVLIVTGGWTAAAFLLAFVLGKSIRIAEEIENGREWV